MRVGKAGVQIPLSSSIKKGGIGACLYHRFCMVTEIRNLWVSSRKREKAGMPDLGGEMLKATPTNIKERILF